jgi:MSHA biogenesis protein MshO
MQFLKEFHTDFRQQKAPGKCPGSTQSCIMRKSGFTLVELIMVMVLLGIVGAMGAQFISQAFQGFADTDARTEIYEEGKLGLVRMERELYHAVPNAINVSGANSDTITFGIIDESEMQNVFGQYSEINPVGSNSITDLTSGLPGNSLISIFNTSWGTFNTGSRIYTVTTNNVNPMTLDSNIGVSSPYQRYFVVRNKAIQYQVTGSTLSRLTADVDSSGPGVFGNPQPVIKNISQSGALPYFDYAAGTATNNGRLTIHFTISGNNESVTFQKEISIRNVP